MKSPLSEEEKNELQDALQYHEGMYKKFVSSLLIVILITGIAVYFATDHVYLSILNLVIMAGLAVWITYSLNRKKVRELRRDIENGYKKCDITEIRKKRRNRVYLKNGMEVFDGEFEFFELRYENVQDKMLRIEYTPENKYILNIDLHKPE